MRIKDVKIGESYRHKDHPSYAWAKAREIIPATRTHGVLIRCNYSTHRDDTFGFVKYFKPSDLLKDAP